MANSMGLYAAHGETLMHFQLNASTGGIELLCEVTLEANVQFAVARPAQGFLYLVVSDAGAGKLGAKGTIHRLKAFKQLKNGELQPFGESIELPERPIHMDVDAQGRYAFVAYNQSAFLSMHPIACDGGVGPAIRHEILPSAGIFTHQVVACPNQAVVIALARGNDADGDKPEELGSAHSFSFAEHALQPLSIQTFPAGLGPRHLAFHPTKPWVYVALERGNKLAMHKLSGDGEVQFPALYQVEALQDLSHLTFRKQRGGVLQLHPNGRFAYVTNRSDAVQAAPYSDLFAGGENTLAVFALDSLTGEPRLLQHVDTQGIEARTFSITPDGQMLVIANQKSLWTNAGRVPSNLAFFRISEEGTLTFISKHHMPDDGRWLLWMDTYSL